MLGECLYPLNTKVLQWVVKEVIGEVIGLNKEVIGETKEDSMDPHKVDGEDLNKGVGDKDLKVDGEDHKGDLLGDGDKGHKGEVGEMDLRDLLEDGDKDLKVGGVTDHSKEEDGVEMDLKVDGEEIKEDGDYFRIF